MLKAMHTASSGMLAQQMNVDNIANNLAASCADNTAIQDKKGTDRDQLRKSSR